MPSTSLRRGKGKDRRSKKAQWSQNQRLQVVSTYLLLGSATETALVTGVPLATIRVWKTQDWFKEAMLQLKTEDVQQLDSNMKRVLDKALKAVEDRIDLGDAQYDPRTGEIVRIPVKAQVALRITTDLLDRKMKLEAKPQQEAIETTINDRLLKLSEEFSRFAKAKYALSKEEPIDVEAVEISKEVVPSNTHEQA